MATSKAQRFGIWVIVVLMILGTLVSFVIIALANQNDATDAALVQKQQTEYQQAQTEYAEKLHAVFTENFGEYATYSDRVSEFDAEAVTELQSEDLKVGEGAVVPEGGKVTAFYVGWNPKGEVFDSSFENGKVVKAPFDTSVGAIEGWDKGAVGMHEGGVRLLTIPAELAYGETGSGESIPPNTPLRFIMFVLPADIELPEQPEMPEELYQSLIRQYGGQ